MTVVGYLKAHPNRIGMTIGFFLLLVIAIFIVLYQHAPPPP
jgi:hypothetical protein